MFLTGNVTFLQVPAHYLSPQGQFCFMIARLSVLDDSFHESPALQLSDGQRFTNTRRGYRNAQVVKCSVGTEFYFLLSQISIESEDRTLAQTLTLTLTLINT